MKALIIYHSITGNTRKIAHAVHKGMSGLTDQCDIVAIKGIQGVIGMKMGHILEYDLIGFGSPVWRSSMTPNMMLFMNQIPTQELQMFFARDSYKVLSPAEKQHFFFFITHGKYPGAAIVRAWEALNARDLCVIGWDDWYGNAAMSYAAQPWNTYGHPDELDLKEAEEFGRRMVDRSLKISQGEESLIPKLPTGKAYEELYGLTPKLPFDPSNARHSMSSRFKIKHYYGVKIIKEKCINCGLCEEHCPMGAIDLDAENPILPSCIWCTTCDLVCPVGAIDLNMEELKKDRGVTQEDVNELGQEMQKGFEKQQLLLRPEKRMRLLIDPKEIYTKGYVYDIMPSPRVRIPEEGWKQRNKRK